MTAGPTCPVERLGSPCPPGIWSGDVEATVTLDGAVDCDGCGTLTLDGVDAGEWCPPM